MRTAIKVFSIIGLAFMGLGLLGNYDDPTAFVSSLIVVIPWAPLCILSLIYIKDKK